MHRLTAKDDALTDDLVQNVYIRLWETIDTIAEGDNLPLLYTIAKRQLIDHYRKTLAKQATLSRWMENQPEEGADTISDQLTYKEIHQGIEKALQAMPERRRTIYMLCREEGLSHREIASRLNISADSVQQQMHLALKALQKEFGHFRQGETALLLAVAITSLNSDGAFISEMLDYVC